MANYVFWIFVSTRFHHQMQVPWHAQIRIFFSCACSFLPLSPAYFVIVWFLCVLSLVFCCHPTYLQQDAASIGAACWVERGTTPAKPKPFAHTSAHNRNRNLTKYSTTI
jgi:hypothetical protein